MDGQAIMPVETVVMDGGSHVTVYREVSPSAPINRQQIRPVCDHA